MSISTFRVHITIGQKSNVSAFFNIIFKFRKIKFFDQNQFLFSFFDF